MSVFVDEVAKVVGLPLNEIQNDYKITNVGGKVIRISGYQKIILYTKEKLVLKVKGDTLIVEGKNMIISEMEGKEIAISGNIQRTYLGSCGGEDK